MILVLFLSACSDNSISGNAGDPKDTASDGTGVDDTANDSGAIEDPATPAWYAVNAVVALSSGAPDPATATIEVEVVDEDLVRIDCTVPLDPAALTGAEAPSDEIYTWWTLTVAPLEEPCTTLPTTIELGLGALDPEVRARLGSVDLDDAADRLWGAWMRVDGGDLWATGYAAAASDPDTAAVPPPDDVYTLVPLFLVPLP